MNINTRLDKINKLCELNGCVFLGSYNIEEYDFEKVKIKFICSCGNEDEKTYGAFRRFPRCIKCGNLNCGNNKRFTIDKIREAFNEKNCTLLENKYNNAHQLLEYMCNDCGSIYKTTWNNFTKIESACKKCLNLNAERQKMSLEELKNKLLEMNIELYTEDFDYKNRLETKLPVKCQRCGKLQYRSFAVLYRNKKCVCKECEKTNLLTLEEAKKIIYDKHGVELLSYNGHKKYCMYKCKCGNVNEVNYTTIYNHGVWCPYCMKTRSKGEEFVKNWLMDNNIEFKYEKTFDDLKYIGKLKIDFYLPEYSVAIEVDGEHHREAVMYGGEDEFSIVKERDSLKNDYCRDNNIILIRLPYYSDDVKRFSMDVLPTLERIKRMI